MQRAPVVFRKTSNYVLGWLGVLGMLAVIVGVDMLHLYSMYPDEPEDSFLDGLPIVGVLAGAALIFHLFGTRPRVELHSGHVLLRNPLRDVALPIASIDGIKQEGAFPQFVSRGRRFTTWGMERWVVERASGRGGALGQLIQDIESRRVPARTSPCLAETSVKWRRLGWEDVVATGLYMSYVGAAAVATAAGWSPTPFR